MYTLFIEVRSGETYKLEHDDKMGVIRMAAQIAASGLTLVQDERFIAVPSTSIDKVVAVAADEETDPITQEDYQTIIDQGRGDIESWMKMAFSKEGGDIN